MLMVDAFEDLPVRDCEAIALVSEVDEYAEGEPGLAETGPVNYRLLRVCSPELAASIVERAAHKRRTAGKTPSAAHQRRGRWCHLPVGDPARGA